MNLLDLLVRYHEARTYSPKIYATHLAVQLLGHSLGPGSININRPPRGVTHNSYICLLGKSGKTKKSTAQNDTIGRLYPDNVVGPASFSPEGLLKIMKDNPSIYCPMGEFSTVLRSIKYGGNMSNFKEIANDLSTSRSIYSKKLVNGEYTVKNPYLSLSTTCTVEEFEDNLLPSMVHGGFLPRWLLVHSNEPIRKRITLPLNISDIETGLQKIIGDMYLQFSKSPIKFKLDDEADDLVYDIQCEWEDNEKYEDIQPFVARYMEYLVKYADVHRMIEYTNNTIYTEQTNFTEYTSSWLKSFSITPPMYSVNTVNSVDIAWAKALIEPSLMYASKFTSALNEETTVGKVLGVLSDHTPVSYSEVLHRSHLRASQMREVMDTLRERNQYTIKIETTGEGKAKKSKQMIYKIKEEGKT
jgi:hypothetical protein